MSLSDSLQTSFLATPTGPPRQCKWYCWPPWSFTHLENDFV